MPHYEYAVVVRPGRAEVMTDFSIIEEELKKGGRDRKGLRVGEPDWEAEQRKD